MILQWLRLARCAKDFMKFSFTPMGSFPKMLLLSQQCTGTNFVATLVSSTLCSVLVAPMAAETAMHDIRRGIYLQPCL